MSLYNIIIYNIIIIQTLVINHGEAQCTFNEYVSSSFCGLTDLKVYEDIPLQDNSAQTWLKKVGQTAGQWGFGALALKKTIPGPAAGMVSAGIANLIGAITGEFNNDNQNDQLTLKKAFEDNIEKELNKVKECIDEKIYKAFAAEDKSSIKAFLMTFNETAKNITVIDNTDKAAFIQTVNQEIEDFEDLIRDIRSWLKSNFDTENKPDRYFESQLAVFDAFVPVYDEIMSAYLMFLKQCKTDPGYADFRSECNNYEHTLKSDVKWDVEYLIKWIDAAYPAIDRVYTAKIESLDRGYTSVSEIRETKYGFLNYHRGFYIKEIEFGWSSSGWLGKARADTVDDDRDWVSISIDMYGSDDCWVSSMWCETTETKGWSSSWQGNQYTEYASNDCRQKLLNKAIDVYNKYISEKNTWKNNFVTKHINPIKALNHKINEFLIDSNLYNRPVSIKNQDKCLTSNGVNNNPTISQCGFVDNWESSAITAVMKAMIAISGRQNQKWIYDHETNEIRDYTNNCLIAIDNSVMVLECTDVSKEQREWFRVENTYIEQTSADGEKMCLKNNGGSAQFGYCSYDDTEDWTFDVFDGGILSD